MLLLLAIDLLINLTVLTAFLYRHCYPKRKRVFVIKSKWTEEQFERFRELYVKKEEKQ